MSTCNDVWRECKSKFPTEGDCRGVFLITEVKQFRASLVLGWVTANFLITEVKQSRVSLVLGWVTARIYLKMLDLFNDV